MVEIPAPVVTTDMAAMVFTWKSLNIVIRVEQLTNQGDCELYVIHNNGNTKRLLRHTTAHLLSTSHLTGIIRELNKSIKDLNWSTIFTYVTNIALTEYRKGEPVIELTEDYGKVKPEYLLYPLFVKNAINTLYADRSSAKTLFITLIDIMLTLPWTDNPLGLNVDSHSHSILFLDWENNPDINGWTANSLIRGMGVGYCPIQYRHCSLPLKDDIAQIKTKVAELKADTIIIDSLGMAVGEDLNLTKPAFQFFAACRQLDPITIIAVAHTAKNLDMKKKTVYGNAYYENEARCYSSDTEVLTKTGWKLHQDIKLTDDICCYEVTPNGQTLRWDKPSKCWEYDYEGKIISINHKGVNALITPNHRVLTNNHELIEAKQLLRYKSSAYQVPYSGILRKRGKHTGRMKSTFQLSLGHKWLNLNSFLRFLGYWISEGGLSGGLKSNITLTQNEGPILNDMKAVLDELGFSYTDNVRNYPQPKCKPGHTIVIRFDAGEKYNRKGGNPRPGRGKGKQRVLSSWLTSNCGDNSSNKHLPALVWELSVKQMKILLKALIAGGGHQYEAGHACYSTISQSLANDIQRLSMLVGLPAKLTSRKRTIGRIQYELLLSKPNRKTRTISPKNCRQVDYSGKVHCLTVPTGFYVTRRKGTTAILGNSIWEIKKEQETNSPELTVNLYHRKPPPFAPAHSPLAYRFTFEDDKTLVAIGDARADARGEREVTDTEIVKAIIADNDGVMRKDIFELANHVVPLNTIGVVLYRLKERGEITKLDNGYVITK